jgi:predicted acylesterase/phospholipase RssA
VIEAVPRKVAVILSGAVAKGAYAAGALRVLAEQDIEVTRLVAASAGALNAAMYASYLRRGGERHGAEELVKLWIDHASFWSVFSLDLISVLRLEGVSSAAKMRRLLRSRIEAGAVGRPRPISLRILVAPLSGVHSHRLDARARAEDDDPLPPGANRTTYEYVCDFDQDDFRTEVARDRVVEAALASAAFPFVFQPVCVDPVGRCIDGGAVNNAPIKWAVGGEIGDELDAILVIAPTPERALCAPEDLRGRRLISQAASMLINERLYRDLREAERINTQLARLEELGQGALTQVQLDQVKTALGWTNMKQVRILQIRPLEPLGGTAFSGFASRPLRKRYVEAGHARAEAVFRDPANRWLFSDDQPEPLRLVARPPRQEDLAPGGTRRPRRA